MQISRKIMLKEHWLCRKWLLQKMDRLQGEYKILQEMRLYSNLMQQLNRVIKLLLLCPKQVCGINLEGRLITLNHNPKQFKKHLLWYKTMVLKRRVVSPCPLQLMVSERLDPLAPLDPLVVTP